MKIKSAEFTIRLAQEILFDSFESIEPVDVFYSIKSSILIPFYNNLLDSYDRFSMVKSPTIHRMINTIELSSKSIKHSNHSMNSLNYLDNSIDSFVNIKTEFGGFASFYRIQQTFAIKRIQHRIQ